MILKLRIQKKLFNTSGNRYSSSKSIFKDTYGAFINGQEVFTDKTFAISSPATTNFLTNCVACSTQEVSIAADAAQQAYLSGTWSKKDVRLRCQLLYKIADALRQNIPRLIDYEVAQTGRPIREMRAQLGRLPEWFEYFGSLIRTHEGSCPPFFGPYVNYVTRVPLGVVSQLTPWNHPLLIAVKKIAPALACGNSILLKPSELAPISVIELAKIIHECGLPAGVLNVLPGIGAEVGQELCKHPHVRKVDLTGGTSTGRLVGSAAGNNLASVITELGGKAPMIIFPDCDLDQAINGCAFATFVASGQTCIMGARLLVHESIYDEFISRLVNKVKNIKLGDPNCFDTQMGPVISQQSLNRITTMVNMAKKEGANILIGGDEPKDLIEPFSKGYYYLPTVMEVKTSMEIWNEEVFGPVVVATKFSSEEEAIQLANDSQYGLAASIWTNNIMRGHRVADQLDVGIIWINDHHRNDPSSPWGGQKNSGVGRENGLNALHEYTQSRSVIVKTDPTPFDWFEQKNARYS